MKGHQWTTEEIDLVRAHRHMHKAEIAGLVTRRCGFACSIDMVKGVFARKGISSGRDGRFPSGHEPFNKGKKGVNGRPSATCFHDGHRPHNWQPVGTERINGDGYCEIKVAEPRTWRGKHVLVWESLHGPVPPGHVVIFADRDRRNFAPKNLLCLSRAELAVMNKRRLITTCTEATVVGRTVARLVMAARKRTLRRAER